MLLLLESDVYSDLSANGGALFKGRHLFETQRLLE